MEEWHERGSDRSRGFRGIIDVELARLDTLAYDRLEDRHHPLDMQRVLEQMLAIVREAAGRLCLLLASGRHLVARSASSVTAGFPRKNPSSEPTAKTYGLGRD